MFCSPWTRHASSSSRDATVDESQLQERIQTASTHSDTSAIRRRPIQFDDLWITFSLTPPSSFTCAQTRALVEVLWIRKLCFELNASLTHPCWIDPKPIYDMTSKNFRRQAFSRARVALILAWIQQMQFANDRFTYADRSMRWVTRFFLLSLETIWIRGVCFIFVRFYLTRDWRERCC